MPFHFNLPSVSLSLASGFHFILPLHPLSVTFSSSSWKEKEEEKRKAKMGFLEKTIHSFLGLFQSKEEPLPTSTSTSQSQSQQHCRLIQTNAGDTQKPPNLLESTATKPICNTNADKKDCRTFDFLFDDASKGRNGLLTSCTESLGFESSDQPIKESLEEEPMRSRSMVARARWKTTVAKVKTQDTKFPPPLSSLNQNGQRSFYLKSVRRNGRLELTEVRIQRPEVFRASRQDGRLRLQSVETI